MDARRGKRERRGHGSADVGVGCADGDHGVGGRAGVWLQLLVVCESELIDANDDALADDET